MSHELSLVLSGVAGIGVGLALGCLAVRVDQWFRGF